MRVRAWLHPRGVVRVTVSHAAGGMSWGKSLPLDDVPPQTVLAWLDHADMDPRTRQVLLAYLWSYM